MKKSRIVSKVVGKRDVLKQVIKDTGIDPALASFVYDVLFDSIKRQLIKGNGVLFPGVGRLVLVHGRSFKSNMTGVLIPEHKKIQFYANARFAREIRVNSRDYKIKS